MVETLELEKRIFKLPCIGFLDMKISFTIYLTPKRLLIRILDENPYIILFRVRVSFQIMFKSLLS